MLKHRRLAKEKASAKDLANLLRMAEEDLAIAEKLDWTDRGRYLHAYGAAQALSAVVVRGSGYKPRGEGHHEALFIALEPLAPATKDFAMTFDKARRKRHKMTYENPDAATPDEVQELFKRVGEFKGDVLKWAKPNRPDALSP